MSLFTEEKHNRNCGSFILMSAWKRHACFLDEVSYAASPVDLERFVLYGKILFGTTADNFHLVSLHKHTTSGHIHVADFVFVFVSLQLKNCTGSKSRAGDGGKFLV